MKTIKISTFFILTLILASCSTSSKTDLSLEGEWFVKLDSLDIGISQNWAGQSFGGTSIHLPGTLDDAGLGKKTTLQPELNNNILASLTRLHQYIGVAWYQKQVKIPRSWKGKKIKLELERVIWESQLFVDGIRIGQQESLITPHYYVLTEDLKPGYHTLTIRIDNSNKYPLINVKGIKYPDPVNQDMAHAYTNHTQIKWNGIIGDIKLSASGPSRIANLQVYPNINENRIRVTFQGHSQLKTKLEYQITSTDEQLIIEGQTDEEKGEFLIPIDGELNLWDEFNPHLYELILSNGDESTSVRFGYRQIKNNNSVLSLNGERIFLRGNLECAIFPLTGHPPMEKNEWAALIFQAKAYGLNHLRFHSYCPPKAAFEAADEAGFYFQVELPHWSLRFGEDEKTTEFLLQEAKCLLKEYGNHPSFIMMALGNELHGPPELMNSIVAELRAKDDRHLYATTSFSFQYPLGAVAQEEDDFLISQKTDKGWIRGQGIFNSEFPNFSKDYTETSQHVPVPLISHEIGQYAVYPDLKEIEQYKGVLSPLNFIAIQKALEEKNMIDLADDFTQASGQLAAILYKEEIERALKTPSFDGFQLLQLQDFPGQGTALVGLLNAFWKSKGIISAEEFRKFNSELVPLLRFDKAVFENGETFHASIEVSNFFKELETQDLNWSITDESGGLVSKGVLKNIDLKIGNNPNIGVIDFPIETIKAEKLTINLQLAGTEYQNNWSIWVYPDKLPDNPDEILVTTSLKAAQQALDEGGSVLFNPDYKDLKGTDGRFVPVFWSPVHFPDQPSSMGLLIDDEHPAFKDFPTDSHTNWQWWDLSIHSKSISIDSLNVRPLVRVIDNFVTNRNLTSVFEAKVGQGKLILSSIDLINDLDNRPVARQLRYSLLRYMSSEAFNPSGSIDINKIYFEK